METTAMLKTPPGDCGVRSTRYFLPPAASRLDFSINSSLCEPTRYNTSDISWGALQVTDSRIIAVDDVTMMVVMLMMMIARI
jgi:hypothetical protein